MESETEIGQLVIDLKIKTEALEKGLETAKNKLQDIEKQNEQVKNSNNQLDASFIAMSAGIVASLAKIKSAVDDGVQKYNNYINSMKALQKTAKATDNSFSDIKESMEDVNKLKLMDDADVTASTKNLLTYGFTVKQTSDILKVLQDAAVGNRQANYTLSEAVRVTTEGIRMENSALSDAAGVQKNISKMYEEYAQKIGKTIDSLTQAEKAQAVYNGIMAEASMFTGSAVEMAQGYQGVQAQVNASNLELSRTIGESMIPALTQYSSLQLTITQGLTEFIKNHKGATSGVITFTTALLATIVGLTALKKAHTAYIATAKAADMTTKAFTISLMSNPITLIAVGIAAVVAGLAVFDTKMQESIEKMEEATEKSKTLSDAMMNFMKNGEYTEGEKDTVTQARDEAAEIIRIYEEKTNKIEEINNRIKEINSKGDWNTSYAEYEELKKLKDELYNTKEALKNFQKEKMTDGLSIDDYKKKVEALNKILDINSAKQEYSRLTNVKANRETLVSIAQTKADIRGKQQLLNVLKEGKTSTEAYKNAKSQLVKIYPELAKVNENTIATTQATIDAENKAANAEWALAQTTIMESIAELTAMQANDEKVQQIAIATKQKVEDVKKSIIEATNALTELSKLKPDDFKKSITPTYTPVSTTTTSGSSSYQNKALDNYKKQIEHKKALDKISLKQEISMYQTALKRYAKTQDEKWELQEKIYELQQELQEKTLDDYASMIEHKKAMDKLSLQEEIKMYQTALKKYAKNQDEKWEIQEKIYELQQELQEKTLNDYTTAIEHKKTMDKLSLQEEVKMYQTALEKYAKTAEQKQEIREKLYELNKEIAQKERELLNQQTEDYETYIEKQRNMRGASYTVEEQTSDYDKIIKMHKSYLEQIMKDERLSLDERKEIYREELSTIRQYEQQKRDLRVQAIDNTASQLTNAITKQLEEMQNKEKDLLDKNLKTIEEWKDARVNAINEEYDARIEAIERELEALDKAEKQKTRDEEDADYEKKKKRLEDLIAFEHDATTKANYQKELDKLIAEHQKTLDKRELSDKKEALNEQKNLLKDEQDNKIKQIEAETEKKKEAYDEQLKALEEYYEEQISKAEETAQQMLLNVEDNQNQIIALLQTYGDAYAITGQTFGEKLGQSFADTAMQKIQNVISQMQKVIDNAIESNIARLSSATAKYEAKDSKGSTVINKTVNVEQNNTITSPVDSPSTAYKKQETLQRNLANSIATVF